MTSLHSWGVRDDSCPSHDLLAGFVERELEETERLAIESHIEACAHCRTTVAHLVATFAEPRAEPVSLPQPGAKLGRYHVLDWVAAGSMGAVFLADDPQLRRRVALKVLPPRDDAEGAAQRDRFLGEAQAIATVSHPNVIAVHDVGVHDGIAFFTMEYVEGVTLRRWLAEPRTVAQIVEVFVAAGEGLAAAHGAGLVHRDFKPDNVVVGDDARVRVIDFGLARFATASTIEDVERSTVSAVATGVGSRVGTPAYMAPEQLRGAAADARSDQFSFCVALYEALCERRPWQGATVAELTRRVAREPISWECARPGVSRSLRRAIERGLACAPADRFATMAELVGRLRGRAWSRPIVVLAFAAGVAGAALGLYGILGVDRGPQCVAGSERLAGIWDASIRSELESQLTAGDLDEAGGWLVGELDGYAVAWAGRYDTACRAVLERGPSLRFVDPSMVCLEHARDRFDATVGVVREVGADAIAEAPRIVEGLDAIERCDAGEASLPSVPPPEHDQQADVDAVRRQLARVGALRTVGRFDEAKALATEAERRASEVAYTPIRLEAELAVARAAGADGQRAALPDMLQRALAEGHHEVAAEAATLLACRAADADDVGSARAYATTALGLVGRPGVSASVASIHECLARIALTAGDFDAAAAELRSAVALTTARLGTSHPRTAHLQGKLAEVLSWQRHDAESDRLFESATALLMRELGAGHPWVLAVRLQRAQVRVQTGALAEAEAEVREVLAHSGNAAAHGLLGHILAERGALPAAEAEYRLAAERFTAVDGPLHSNTLGAKASVAQVLFAQKRFEDASRAYGDVISELEQALGRDHPEVVQMQVYFLLAEQEQGRVAETRAPLREVVDRCARGEQVDPLSCMTAASLLARVVLEVDRDVEGARELAELAEASLADVPHVPPDHREYLEVVWDAVRRAEGSISPRRAPTTAVAPR